MMRSLVIRFSGDIDVAVEQLRALGDDDIAVAGPEEIVRRSTGLRRGYGRLAILGCPPEDEIGYGLVPFFGLLCRPRWITLLDAPTRTAQTLGLTRFVVRALPQSVQQLVMSAAAILVQRAIVALLRAPSTRPIGRLRHLVYLRPLVGVPAAVGGAVTHTHEIIRELRASGINVNAYTTDASIVATAAAEDSPPCEWRLVRPARSLRALPASAAFAADLALIRAALGRARDSDAVYQRHARFSLVGPLLARLARRPLILEYNGSEAFFGEHWQRTPLLRHLRRLERAALRAATRVVVVSEVERMRLLERFGIPADRIIVSPNGVDVGRFDRGGGAEMRRALGLESAFVVGFVGSFGPWHGAPILAHAFLELLNHVPQARLLLVGDGPELSKVREILADGDLTSCATEVGKVPPHSVPAYLDACDVLTSPHVPMPNGEEFFGSPTKLFEYMAARKPIVASAVGQIAEVLEHEQSALLVPAGDVGALAAALVRLANDAELRDALGRASRDRAKEHTWRSNVRHLVTSLEQRSC